MSDPHTGGLAKLDPTDDRAVADLCELYNTTETVDEPWQPGWTPGQLAGSVRHGWDGEPGDRWLLRDHSGDGALIGALRLSRSKRDNLHHAGLAVLVHPKHRRSDGVFAGHTMVGVHPEQPGCGGQHDTSVLKDHRGHRLGLLPKASMVQWLAETEPQLRMVDTSNAESNAHMIGINEQLGYRVVGRYLSWQKELS